MSNPDDDTDLIGESEPIHTPPSAREQSALSEYSDGLAKARIRSEHQRYWIRWGGCVAAVLTMLIMAALEFFILSRLMDSAAIRSDGFFYLAIAPIVSITAIMVFVLIGAFQGYGRRDLNQTPTETAVRAIGGGTGHGIPSAGDL